MSKNKIIVAIHVYIFLAALALYLDGVLFLADVGMTLGILIMTGAAHTSLWLRKRKTR